ncbi:MAG: hypothetical protein AB7I30_05795 [Isosphaeraceae bacterium]
MSRMSSGTALRNLQQAQSGLRKARQALKLAREDPDAIPGVLKVGWESLAQMHRILAEIPLDAATEPVMSKQLSVERYGTALLVRLRRLVRGGVATDSDDDGLDHDLDGDDALDDF